MICENFHDRAQTLHRRVQQLYQTAAPELSAEPLLQKALDELEAALELIQLADVELCQSRADVDNLRQATLTEIQLYQELFTFAPAPYLVTSLTGTIRKANQAASEMFGVPERRIIGRALALFIPEGQRRAFHDELARRCQTEDERPWQIRMQWPDRAAFDAAAALSVVRDRYGDPQSIRWLLREAAVLQ